MTTNSQFKYHCVARISPDDPDFFNEAKYAVYLMEFYSVPKRKYFDRFVKHRTATAFRTFEAVTSKRFIYEGCTATRGIQRDRNGKIKTVRFDLFTAIRDSNLVAEEELKKKFNRTKPEVQLGSTFSPDHEARQEAKRQYKEKKKQQSSNRRNKTKQQQNNHTYEHENHTTH